MIKDRARQGILIAALSTTALSVLITGGCQTNATTGRSQYNALSRDEEISMGSQSMPEMIKQYGGTVPSPQAQAYVTNIGKQLTTKTEADNASLPWEFTFLNTDVINAFALPGGKVFVTRGLASKMTNEAQMAGVLGHEIGHVTARHINDQIAREQGAQLGAVLIGVAVGATTKSSNSAAVSSAAAAGATTVASVVLLKYSRDQEYEADALGVRYMSRLFYDPIGQVQVMQILQKLAAGGGTPEFLETHPYPENRITRLQGMLKGEYAYTQNNPQYQLYEARFREQFLTVLSKLPPAPPPPPAPKAEKTDDATRLALGPPSEWCAHCRELAAQQSREQQR